MKEQISKTFSGRCPKHCHNLEDIALDIRMLTEEQVVWCSENSNSNRPIKITVIVEDILHDHER